MGDIVLAGATSGTTTLTPTAVSGTTTLTLPATTGTVITTGDTGTVTKTMISTSTSTGFGLCRAWVNFVGSSGSINKSFNISSVTRTSTGVYTVNFTTAMPDATYAVVTTCFSDASTFGFSIGASSLTTSSVGIQCRAGASAFAYYDSPAIHVAIFD